MRSRTVTSLKRHHYYERFYASSYSSDITDGDVTAGEDPVVRQAAIDALGNMNGTVLAIEPTSGRVLAMVNQKLALSSGAQPCSTIKVSVALAVGVGVSTTPAVPVQLPDAQWSLPVQTLKSLQLWPSFVDCLLTQLPVVSALRLSV